MIHFVVAISKSPDQLKHLSVSGETNADRRMIDFDIGACDYSHLRELVTELLHSKDLIVRHQNESWSFTAFGKLCLDLLYVFVWDDSYLRCLLLQELFEILTTCRHEYSQLFSIQNIYKPVLPRVDA